MKTPGITVNPLLGMNRAHLFNEVFFDDVRVPVENRLGEENQGWTVTRTVMNFERSNIGGIATAKRILDELVAFLKTCKRNSRPLTEDPIVKDELAKMAVEIEVGRALSYKVAWIQEKGDIFQAVPLASAAKAFGTETMQRVIYRALEILGQAGVTKKESSLSVMLGRFETFFQVILGMNIAGGSSEVQRNLIAWTALGLPRSWDEVFKKPTKS
jgi:alkylation response protein AidB-like acyl-CoA dehydrogenase